MEDRKRGLRAATVRERICGRSGFPARCERQVAFHTTNGLFRRRPSREGIGERYTACSQ